MYSQLLTTKIKESYSHLLGFLQFLCEAAKLSDTLMMFVGISYANLQRNSLSLGGESILRGHFVKAPFFR